MWPKVLILVLAAFLALGIGTPAFADAGPNLGDPGDVDPWGGENQNDDGSGDIDPGEGVIPVIDNMPALFIRITIDRTWLFMTEIINKPYHPKDEPRYIEQRLETSEVNQTPIYINKRTGIR